MIGCGAVSVFQTVNQLGAAEQMGWRIFDHGMTAAFELVFDMGRKARLQGDAKILIDVPARRIARRLRILDVVENSDHHLDMTLGLHVSAHNPEAHQRLVIPGHEARNDGVKRAFAAGDTIWVASFDHDLVRCLWRHEPSGMTVNCNGGYWHCYEEATSRAYESQTRAVLQEA